MDVYGGAYTKIIAENQHQTNFWESYLSNLKELDLHLYSTKMKVPCLIPVGSRMLFRGDLIHTNEITVSLGANYFAKCSTKQAEIHKQHRIRGAEEKLELLKTERNYLENQFMFTQKNVLEETGQEIIEVHSEEEESAWKLKHRENVRKYKQDNKCDAESSMITDDDLWSRLEELELKEELENEYSDTHSSTTVSTATIAKEHETDIPNQNVEDSVKELENRLIEVAKKVSGEEDVFRRLDMLEEQEALEDELDRQEYDDSDIEDDTDDFIKKTPKKTLSFACNDEPFCINIHFKHSNSSPDFTEYNNNKGITKPSDIYAAYPENFRDKGIIPILKKKEYAPEAAKKPEENSFNQTEIHKSPKPDYISPKHIDVMGEVIENTNLVVNENKTTHDAARPPSKFKAMRMKNQ